MQGKVTGAAWTSSILTVISSLSLPDWACLIGIISTIGLSIWKIYVDLRIVHAAEAKNIKE